MAASEMAVWGEIVASLAVLVTLVFLTVQIRQAKALMRSETRSTPPPGLPIGRSYPLHSAHSGRVPSGILARCSSIWNLWKSSMK